MYSGYIVAKQNPQTSENDKESKKNDQDSANVGRTGPTDCMDEERDGKKQR